MSKNKYAMLAMCIGLQAIMLTGCAEQEPEEPIIMVDNTVSEVTYNMDEVTTGNVVKTQNINAKYVQTEDQEVSFPVGGKRVEKVHVKVGDIVEVGDVLVELECSDLEDEIARLEYQIARNELLLGYLDQAEEFDLQSAYYSFVYDTAKEEDDLKNLEKRNDSIEEGYTYSREDYEDNIEFDKKKLNQLKSTLTESRVVATMSGKVMSVAKNLEGSTAKRGDVIMTIVDNENGIFETEDTAAAQYFNEGQTVEMNVAYGDAKGAYELMPYEKSSWGEKQQFTIISGPDNATLEVGTSGTIVATIDKKENVTRIPCMALYDADGKYYTYILDENNMRKAQFIEIGLIGDSYVEVISGIEVGTKVVKR